MLDEHIPSSERIRLTGPRGTLILCDTGGLHRGGHARGRSRVLAYQTYVSPAAPWEKVYFEIDWRGGGSLSRQARYALT